MKSSPWRTPPLKRSRETSALFGGTRSPPVTPSFANRSSATTTSRLNEAIPAREVSKRVGPGGKALYYLQGWQAIQVANEIFGYGGWSNALQSFDVDYCEQGPDGRWNAMATAVMRVTLMETGAFHEDIGCGVCDGMRTRGDALQKVKKEACTDAMKRALKNFGRRLGLMLYDKEFLAMLTSGALGHAALAGARSGDNALGSIQVPAIPAYARGENQKAKQADAVQNGSIQGNSSSDKSIANKANKTSRLESNAGERDARNGGVVSAEIIGRSPGCLTRASAALKASTPTKGNSGMIWNSVTRAELDSLLQQFELDDES
jgi:DNA repair and recombination protein RAD52